MYLWLQLAFVLFLPFRLTHCPLVGFDEILDEWFSNEFQWLMTDIISF